MMRGVLLFDLDGTLMDPREGVTRCLRHGLERIGVVPPDDSALERWIGPPLHDSFRSFLGPEREHLVSAAVAFYRERFAAVGMFENVVYPGVIEALEGLNASGWSLFVATSKPQYFARQIVEHFELPHFKNIYGSALSGERADKITLLAHLLEREGLSADRAIMIGDRAFDMVGAKANGVRAIGALWGYGSREELVNAGADELCESIDELVRVLQADSVL
jgi:phosphoglycolate phosphatase